MVGLPLVLALMAAPRPHPEPHEPEALQVRPSRGEVFVDASERARPPGVRQRRVHGEARLSLGLGWVLEDPIVALGPSIELDLTEVAPIRLAFGPIFRLRMYDREPDQPGVLRRRDWDEVGDYFAMVRRFEYADAFVFGRRGQGWIDLRAGELGRIQLGHGSLVRGYHNSLDIDRRRTGVDAVFQLEAPLLERRAGLEFGVVAGDVAGSQILGTRIGGEWAGAGLGLTVVGDPTAPRTLALDPGDPEALALGRGGGLQTTGRRGVVALGLDLSYRVTDDWRYVVVPYVDLAWMPRLGQGLHVGIDNEVHLGRRRRAHLGAVVELTVGSSGYDPAYFDVFYSSQRWQVPFVASVSDAPEDLGSLAVPKYAFVQREDLSGVGAHGAVRFAHDAGAFAETGYHYRPGALGQTWETRVGVDLRPVALSALLAHRGRHGFEPRADGTVARLDLRVPVIRYLDVEASGGWMFAIREDSGATSATNPTGVMTGGGLFLAGVAGRVPW